MRPLVIGLMLGWWSVSCALLGSCASQGGPDLSEFVGSLLWPVTVPLFAVVRWRHRRAFRRFERLTDERIRSRREVSQ